jgi:hypothetical protein
MTRTRAFVQLAWQGNLESPITLCVISEIVSLQGEGSICKQVDVPLKTKDCATCGNPIPVDSHTCRFCGHPQAGDRGSVRAEAVRTINLESGMPTVRDAMQKMESKLSLAIAQGVRVVRVVHGYGSSGKGGKIRDACRRVLGSMVSKNQVTGMIHGEDHSAACVASQHLLRRVPALKSTCRTDGDNPGITLVEL